MKSESGFSFAMASQPFTQLAQFLHACRRDKSQLCVNGLNTLRIYNTANIC